MADVQIAHPVNTAIPSSYVVKDAVELRLKAVNADFNGAGAAGTYLPCVTILSDAGLVIARAVDQGVSVAAGSDAEVSWFPWLKHRAASGAASGPSCQLLGSANGTDTNTITLTAPVPATGILHVVAAQVSVPDGVDGGSEITAVSDSGAHGPWRFSFAPNDAPFIGNGRQTVAGNLASLQVCGTSRACVANDLGIGSTVTVTWSTVNAANFHTAALLIYQPAYFVTVTQFGSIAYTNSDEHDDWGPSMTRMSYIDDFGAGYGKADRDAAMLSAFAAWPAVAGWQPFSGSVVGELATGTCSIAAACLLAQQDTFPDPGGTLPAGAQALAGNYQLAWARSYATP